MKKMIVLKRIFHRDKWRILISFKYDAEIVALVKQIKGNCYSDTWKGWYTDDNEESLKEIFRKFRDTVEIDISSLTQKLRSVSSESPVALKDISYSDAKPELPESDTGINFPDKEIIPSGKTIERVLDRRRSSPVEFRINEQDGRLAI
jgi:hypothetical protein